MTIKELKAYISEFRDKNSFEYERRDDEITQQLFHPSPDEFEIIKDEKKDKLYIIPALNDFSILFRGQSKEITPCLPSLYRKKLSLIERFIEKMRLVEFEMLLDSHPSIKLFKERCFTLSYEGLAQHYGLKTEVMDFTSDIDIALFFAMCPYDPETDDYKLPEEDQPHTGIIYMLNPMTWDPRAINGNHINIFEELVEPIGLQPFDRPAIQRAYGILLRYGRPLNRVRVYDFEFTMNEAEEYFQRYTELSNLWVKDELVGPTKELSKKCSFLPKVFKHAWERYPIEGMTKSQCLKQLGLWEIKIHQKARIVEFNPEMMTHEILSKRWNSYYSRVKARRIISGVDDGTGKLTDMKEVSPFRTTDIIAREQMLRLSISGMTCPKGGRACKQ
ncbi:MAG: FRG domain-containing protein [Muribaculum sp.]|nr:FRG domain-containing protein [Muribaculum sp.]